MIKRNYKTIKLANDSLDLVIDFEDKKYELLSEFIYFEVRNFGDRIKETINNVLDGIETHSEITFNIFTIDVTRSITKITDNSNDDTRLNYIEIDTLELKNIVDEYYQKLREFRN